MNKRVKSRKDEPKEDRTLSVPQGGVDWPFGKKPDPPVEPDPPAEPDFPKDASWPFRSP